MKRGETLCLCLHSPNNLLWSFDKKNYLVKVAQPFFVRKRLENHLNESKLD